LPLDRILLVRLRKIGDIVLTTPAVEVLKRALPRASLTYVVEAPFRRLVEGHPALDDIVVLPRDASTGDVLAAARDARRKKYDAVLDFHGGPKAWWLTALSGARLKVGYSVKYRSFAYDRRVPRRPEHGRIHSVVNHVNLVRALGLDVPEPPPMSLPDPIPQERERVDALYAGAAPEGTRTVVVHIGAGNAFRDWGEENWTALVLRLARTDRVRVLLAGGTDDRRRAASILARTPSNVFPATDDYNPIELREIIRRASLFIGPDSGPMHIAATTPTPSVVLFGPTVPEITGPWKPTATPIIFQRDLDCRPCRQRTCVHGDFRCLRSIEVREVYDACVRLGCF
jgi:ADP-heptose:LPS heptosyltransferase